MSLMALDVTEATFEQEVLKSETPVIVDFWAEWCGPCHAVAPLLEKIAEERKDEVKLVKVNIDEEQGLSTKYGVMSIPTMILFKDGEPAAAAEDVEPERRADPVADEQPLHVLDARHRAAVDRDDEVLRTEAGGVRGRARHDLDHLDGLDPLFLRFRLGP